VPDGFKWIRLVVADGGTGPTELGISESGIPHGLFPTRYQRRRKAIRSAIGSSSEIGITFPFRLPPNACAHRAAGNDIDFTRDAARRSVCNTLFCTFVSELATLRTRAMHRSAQLPQRVDY
jgi:hypothetical protein